MPLSLIRTFMTHMAPSRLERFKAAVEDDLGKLPDKLKPTLPNAPPPEPNGSDSPEDISVTTVVKANSPGSRDEDTITRTSDGQVTSTSTTFENLTDADNGTLDSDDSEFGCPIEIVPVTEGDETDDVEADTPDNGEGTQEKFTSCLRPSMRRGQVTTYGESFCPILAIAKYPHKYLPKADSQAVASAFFDNGQFWRREWDL
jgi:hypothetical protein